MEQDKKYFVFISYSSYDNEWAVWLRHELEHYHLPASFNGRTDVRDNLRDVFRDRDELSAGPEWDKQVNRALGNTNNLIVICSPNSAKSEAVNKEVEAFIAMGNGDRIFPFIVDGNSPDEYFPKSLKHAKVGGDVNKDGGRDAAFVKVVSGMLNVNFSDLWSRYELEKAEEERKQREQRDNLLRLKSRFIAEKANRLVDDGNSYRARKLLLEVLPKNIMYPDIPLTEEAEKALRNACQHETAVIEEGYYFVSSALSPDGKKIAASHGSRNKIYIYDTRSGVCLNCLEGHSDYIASVEYNSLGTLLASASFDKTIRIWDTESGKCIKTLNGHHEDVVRVFWGPGEDIVTSYSYDETREWNINSGQCLSVKPANRWYGVTRDIYSENLKSIDERITISVDKKKIIVVDKKASEKKILTCHDDILSAKLVKDGTRLVASDGRGIYLWDIINKNEELVYEGQVSGTRTIVIDPSNHTMVLNSILADDSHVLHFFDQKSRSCIKTIYGIPEIKWLASSPIDNCIALSSYYDNNIRIWDMTIEKGVKVMSSHADVNYLSYSPDGRLLASATKDGMIDIWNIEEGNRIKEIKGHKDSVNSVEFSDDGSMLISASDDGSVCVWNTKIWDCIAVFKKFNGYHQEINHASFDHTGKRVVISPTQPRTLNRIIELNTRNQIDFPSLGYSFFSPDDKKLLSYDSSSSSSFHVWDVSRMTKICNFQGYVAAFDKKGDIYCVSGFDCKIRKIHCPLTLQELIDETRERFKDNPLTQEERRMYYLE